MEKEESVEMEKHIEYYEAKRRDLEIQRTYHLSLLRSYEAKLDRVEPLSEEFEETFNGIIRTQDMLKVIGIELRGINMKLAIDDYYNKKQ